MDKTALSKSAYALELQLSKHQNLNHDVGVLMKELRPFIESAKAKTLDDPIGSDALPGQYMFNEGLMRPFPELEEAYTNFKFEMTGGLTPTRKRLLDKIAKL